MLIHNIDLTIQIVSLIRDHGVCGRQNVIDAVLDPDRVSRMEVLRALAALCDMEAITYNVSSDSYIPNADKLEHLDQHLENLRNALLNAARCGLSPLLNVWNCYP